MDKLPIQLQQKLSNRIENNALRELSITSKLIDFSSNDYLGFAKSENIFDVSHQLLIDRKLKINGATGSRLITGNHIFYEETENLIANFHDSETALIFNSGYDANIGFFSSVPQRGDVILFDELIHASIRDGIKMSNAKSYKFKHNDYEDLESLLSKFSKNKSEIYIVTESVFSMDGDSPMLELMVNLADKYKAYLIVDEAHSVGVFGEKGEGLVQMLELQNKIFARIVTFGKGLGCHGAAVLGCSQLKSYLINFARSFIYTTGLSPHSVAVINCAYNKLLIESFVIHQLKENINYFNQQKLLLGINSLFVRSKSAIHSAILPGNDKVKEVAEKLQEKGFDVKPILSPTVPEGQERLRICLHSFNTKEQINEVLELLSNFAF